MRDLPPLVRQGAAWVLPIADASAAALATALLDDDRASRARLLHDALVADPVLTTWAFCVVGERLSEAPDDGSSLPRNAAELAAVLAGCLTDVLRWPDGSASSPRTPQSSADSASCEVWADRVAASLAVADLASKLAEAEGSAEPAAAFFRGLLRGAEAWGFEHSPGTAALGVADSADRPAAAVVARAAQLLGEQAGAEVLDAEGLDAEAAPTEVDVEGSRRRAAEGRRRWLARHPGMADWLRPLAVRLARLDDLERRFHQALEAEKLDAMAEFAAGAGHEINNPLTVIAGRAHLFLQDETDPERRRAAALIAAQAMRIYEMIADMRLFARPPRAEPRRFDLAGLLDGFVEQFAARAAEEGVALTRAGEAGPLEIEADPALVHVAVRAICQNALEAVGGGGRIEVSLRRRGAAVEIRVADDGPGIPPEVRRHVFDPYYSARQAGRGLGLGLSKAWRIVTGHGGRIEIESQPPRGAAFTILLPVEFTPAVAPPVTSAAERPAPDGAG